MSLKATQLVKNRIQDLEELSANCGGSICDYIVKVVNLRERKHKWIADIIVRDVNENSTERHNDCEYPKGEL